MKYRVNLNLFFDDEKDKDAFIAIVKPILLKCSAVGIIAHGVNIGVENKEVSKATWHLCGHDEGKSCEPEQDI